jgi:hypothetical protein
MAMNRIWNHNDFICEFRKYKNQYEKSIKNKIKRIRVQFDPDSSQLPSGFKDENLEAHIKKYIIDPLLKALNWQTDSNLFIEAALRAQEVGSKRRFMDYLGLEQNTNTPLLIVEAKRPDTPLPSSQDPTSLVSHQLAQTLEKLCDSPQSSNPITVRWQKDLWQLSEYINITYKNTRVIPARAVITNGDWLIIFEDVKNAFIDRQPNVIPDQIIVIEKRDEIEKSAKVIFRSLDYYSLVPNAHPIFPSELRAIVKPEDIIYALRALEVNYSETPTANDPVPNINITPVLMLRLISGGFIRVNARESDRMPHKIDFMERHFVDIADIHDKLYKEVCDSLSCNVQIQTSNFQYLDTEVYRELPGLQAYNSWKYLLVTGDTTHFIIKNTNYDQCPFHSADIAARLNCLNQDVPHGPSVSIRTHLSVGTTSCCVHRHVHEVKRIQVNEINRERFSPRTEVEDGPFCRLWGFEKFLCCKCCAFQNVCSISIGNAMPCGRNAI